MSHSDSETHSSKEHRSRQMVSVGQLSCARRGYHCASAARGSPQCGRAFCPSLGPEVHPGLPAPNRPPQTCCLSHSYLPSSCVNTLSACCLILWLEIFIHPKSEHHALVNHFLKYASSTNTDFPHPVYWLPHLLSGQESGWGSN